MSRETVHTGGLKRFVYESKSNDEKREKHKKVKSSTFKDNKEYCAYCNSKYIDFTDKHDCKYCGKYYCEEHRLPEDHECSWLEEDKKKSLTSFGRPNEKEFRYSEINQKPINKIKIQDKIKNYFLDKYGDLIYWLKKREHYKYDFERRANYLITTILIFVASLVGFSIFYSNATKLNEIELWIIKLGGVLILTSLFFAIKFSWRLGKEGINILKRQRNWLKYLIIILVIFLLWHGYTNKDTVLNPVFDTYNKTNFSLFAPVDFGNIYGNTKNYVPDYKSNSSVSNLENFYYGLEDGEARVKDVGFLHFNKIPVYYELNNCFGERKDRVLQAFNIIEKETEGILPFKEKSPGNIIVSCNSQLETEFASGYGGPEYYSGNNQITSGSVELYAHDPQFSRCESYPVTEIHEILHSLGFDHISDKNSIMYEGDTNPIILEDGESDQPYVCIKIETKMINCLKYIYSNSEKGDSCSGIPFL